MRGLDDDEPEENDGVRVRRREVILVYTRVRGWTGKRTRDEARDQERKRD